MKEHIKSSISLVNSYYLYIIAIGFLGAHISGGAYSYFSIIAIPISLVIEITLLGTLVAIISQKSNNNKLQILKDNWLNYLIITFVIATPSTIFQQINNSIALDIGPFLLIKFIISFILMGVFIFAMPIAYLKNENIKALIVSAYYLSTNIKYTLPLLNLLAVTLLIPSLAFTLVYMLHLDSFYLLALLVILLNTAALYLTTIIFCAATKTMVGVNYENKA